MEAVVESFKSSGLFLAVERVPQYNLVKPFGGSDMPSPIRSTMASGGSRGSLFAFSFTDQGVDVMEISLSTGEFINRLLLDGYLITYSESLHALLIVDQSGMTNSYDPDTGNKLKELFSGYVLAADAGSWHSADYTTHVLQPGQTAEVPLAFRSTRYISGTYTAAIDISCNDPVTPKVNLTSTMIVRKGPKVEANLKDFGTVFVNKTSERTLIIKNTGTDPLLISDIISSHKFFTSDKTTLSVGAGEWAEVIIKFNPIEEGTFDESITVNSNDPSRSEFTVPVIAKSVYPPVIEFSPSQLYSALH